ncbi:hypothetical protein GCHA_3764 [Paraglaciecola chathamensis S18K6]|uniref:Uncharacterized protein n=1 Tax=Paraglaciecola chathamensis S18K6 TaxID=1127672 RepID=A0AAV3UXU3_9ALTE|nr:hypothetical protein GCHA_3764 [Paraglaciecola chathamensis S18K6]
MLGLENVNFNEYRIEVSNNAFSTGVMSKLIMNKQHMTKRLVLYLCV